MQGIDACELPTRTGITLRKDELWILDDTWVKQGKALGINFDKMYPNSGTRVRPSLVYNTMTACVLWVSADRRIMMVQVPTIAVPHAMALPGVVPGAAASASVPPAVGATAAGIAAAADLAAGSSTSWAIVQQVCNDRCVVYAVTSLARSA